MADSFDLEGLPAPLAQGESVASNAVSLGREHRLYLAAAGDAAVAVHVHASDGGAWLPLASLHLAGGQPARLEVDLASMAGTERRIRLSAEGGSARIDEFRVCAAFDRGRINAFSNYEARMRTEIGNFSGSAYTHAMYGEQERPTAQGAIRQAVAIGGDPVAPPLLREAALARLAAIEPMAGEVAYAYATRALGMILPPPSRDFPDRARELSARGPLRVLSLCCGAARIEEQILSGCAGPVDLVLVDASRDLLARAAARFEDKPGVRVDCLVADINAGIPARGALDVVMCVSALHHVAGLELVLRQANELLAEDGQFWSIGEQVGRNGNRLWPDALEAANAAFARLPAHLRRNAYTQAIDSEVPDKDFSDGCFEGIRSEELEEKLERHFILREVYKRNAFLWRLVDATYSDNYDLQNPEDLRHLRELVAAEAAHWLAGGRSTELYGVYGKKRLAMWRSV